MKFFKVVIGDGCWDAAWVRSWLVDGFLLFNTPESFYLRAPHPITRIAAQHQPLKSGPSISPPRGNDRFSKPATLEYQREQRGRKSASFEGRVVPGKKSRPLDTQPVMAA